VLEVPRKTFVDVTVIDHVETAKRELNKRAKID
jgi:hypothetical protein